MKRRDTITALCLLAFLAVGFGLLISALLGGGALREQVGLVRRDLSLLPDFLDGGGEAAANEDLDRDHGFIQIFGGVQRLTGRRVVEDPAGGNSVAKLDNGALNFVSLDTAYVDCAENGARTAAFGRALEGEGIPLLFVLAPQKIQRDTDPLPAGVYNYGNEGADSLLAALEREGTDYLDMRPLFEGTGDYGSWFFLTDHHWKPEAAFCAWGEINRVLADRYGLPLPQGLDDPDQWETTVLEDFFLGSQGKRVGTLYAGTDDFTLFAPRFDTSLTYACEAYGFARTGPFSQSVCFPERVEGRDLFGGNPYTYYAGGDYPLASVVNHNNPEGPKILLVRESFACALTPFLALSCGELVMVDLRHFQGDLMETIRAERPDLVMVLYTAGTCSLDHMFDFG